MSRDNLLPPHFQRISPRFKTPYFAILFTGAFMILAIYFLKLELLVKIASTVLILLYIFANLTLILFRESRILSYKPKFYAPFYPYMQILGVLGGIFLLIEMGSFIIFLTILLLFLGFIWYRVYVQKRVVQNTALIHVLERLVAKDKELASGSLLTELKDIVVKREGVLGEKFHKLVEKSKVLDIETPLKMEDFFKKVSNLLGKDLGINPEELFGKFMKREKESSTVIAKGLAIPHIFVEMKDVAKLILVRAKEGIIFPEDQLIHVGFVLVGSVGERILHLKILASIAQIVQNPGFEKKWFEAKNEEEVKHVIFLAEKRK
jgi:basic amino acid/polyamine antiporter, APA family